MASERVVRSGAQSSGSREWRFTAAIDYRLWSAASKREHVRDRHAVAVSLRNLVRPSASAPAGEDGAHAGGACRARRTTSHLRVDGRDCEEGSDYGGRATTGEG